MTLLIMRKVLDKKNLVPRDIPGVNQGLFSQGRTQNISPPPGMGDNDFFDIELDSIISVRLCDTNINTNMS